MPSATDTNTTQPDTTVRKGSAAREADATNGTAEGGYRAKRYALKYEPPCIFLEYEDASRKRRVRAVKLNGVQASVDVDKLTRKVIRSFPRKLEASSVKYDQVRKLVGSLVEYLAKADPNGQSGTPGPPGRSSSLRGPSRLGPGGGGGGGNSHDGGGGRLSDCASHGSDGVAASGSSSFSSPLPTMSPRLDPRGLTHARLGGQLGNLVHSAGNNRGSIESSMSRFSTSTGGGSSDEEVPEEPEEEEEEEEDEAGQGEAEEYGGRGSGGGSRRPGDPLASALDDLEREMAELGSGPVGSSVSTRANISGGSSDLVSSSRDSSFSVRDRPAGPAVCAAAPPPSPASRVGSTTTTAGPEGVGPAAAAAAAAGGPGGPKSRFAAEAEKLTIGMEVTDDTDLNKVTEVELKMAKLAMEQKFRINQLRPGDPGYVYDKQAEFGPPTEDNDWDESGDEDEPEPLEAPEVDWKDIQAAVLKPTSVVVKVPAGAPPVIAIGSGNGNGKAAQSPHSSDGWP